MDEKKVNRRIIFCLFIFIFAIYYLTGSETTVSNTDASQARYEVTKSLVERFDVSIPNDLAGVRGKDGRNYSWYGLGQSLLSVPFYILGNYTGTPRDTVLKINTFFGPAVTVLIFIFSVFLGYSRRASLLAAFFYGMCTMAWPVAKRPFDHTTETFFVLLAGYYMYRYSVCAKVSIILLSGICLGMAFNIRYTSVLALPALFLMTSVYYLKTHDLRNTAKYVARDMTFFALAFLPFLGLSFWYNYARFGSIFETGFSLMAKRLGIDFIGGTPFLTGIGGLLISPGKGFFYYSPVAILFFFSIRSFLRKHSGLGASFICIILSYLLFLSKNIYWHGDWAWGPRYLLVITPFFIIPLAHLFDSSLWLKKRLLRRAVYALFTVSFIIQLAAVSVDYNKYFFHLIYDEKVKFAVVSGEGTPSIVEPPQKTYFECRKSPILAQFKFITQMAEEIKYYRYTEPPEGITTEEKVKAEPFMHAFDYWWWYQFVIDNSYHGFIAALILFLMSICSALYLLLTIKKIENIQEIND